MASFEVRASVNGYDEYSVASLKQMFSNCQINWRILERDIPLTVSLESEITELAANEKDKDLKAKHTWLSFSGELPCSIDTARNRGYDSVDGTFFYLDELYMEEIEKPAFGSILSILLTDPKIDLNCCRIEVFFNNIKFISRIYFLYAIQNMVMEKYNNLINLNLSFQQTWNWIEQNTSLGRKQEKSPTYIASLSYVMSREFHECIVYSIIGLESIYTPKKSQAGTYLLKKRLAHIFPDISEKKIGHLYEARSKIVHGEKELGISFSDSEVLEDASNSEDLALFASALLIESIRMLIANNATAIEFEETISHHFK